MTKVTGLLLVVCATVGCATPPAETGGFEPSRVTRGVRVWRSGDLSGHHRFTVDPVRVVVVEGVTMDPAVSGRIAEQFRRELVVRLADGYEVVDPPGAGVLRLTVVVTDVQPGPALGLAEARVESVITDSVTGQPLLAIRDHRSHARQIDRSLLSEWEAARSVMQSWADAVDVEIDDVGK